jgi:hypothetical protein
MLPSWGKATKAESQEAVFQWQSCWEWWKWWPAAQIGRPIFSLRASLGNPWMCLARSHCQSTEVLSRKCFLALLVPPSTATSLRSSRECKKNNSGKGSMRVGCTLVFISWLEEMETPGPSPPTFLCPSYLSI